MKFHGRRRTLIIDSSPPPPPPPGEKTENRLFSGPRNLLTDREKKCSERNSGELIKNAGQDEHYLVEGAKKSPRSYF